jgi:hypothetical protein
MKGSSRIFPISNRKLILLLLLLAFSIRAFYSGIYLSAYGLDTSSDTEEYIRFGKMMVEEGWMVHNLDKLNSPVGPGYPLILAIDMLLLGNDNYKLTLIIDILLNSLTVVLIYLLGLHLLKEREASAFIGLWSAFYLQYVRYTPLLDKENLVFFLFTLIVYLVLKIREHSRFTIWGLLLLFVVSYSLLIHTDERYLIYLPFIVLFVLFPINSSSIKVTATILLGVFIFMLPWLYRNYKVYERPVILTERVAELTDKIFKIDQPLQGKAEKKKSFYDRKYLKDYEEFTDSLIRGYQLKSTDYLLLQALQEGIQDGNIPRTFNQYEAKWHEFKELLRPVRFSGGYIGNGYRYQRPWKLASNLIYGFQYGLLLVFLPIGLFLLYRQNRLSCSVLFLLGILIIHILFHVSLNHCLQRYRVPIDFIFILIGGYGIYKVLEGLLLKFGRMNKLNIY